MKHIALLIASLIFIISCKNGSIENIENRKLAFQNNEFISCLDLATGKIVNLTVGFDPCISPDGKWIAYTESSDREQGGSRVIRLISTDDSLKTDFNINNKNHYGPIWSPTGEYLAFSIMLDNWHIGLVRPNSSEFTTLSVGPHIDLYAPSWSLDGNFVLAHNLTTLYKFNISGDVVEKYDLVALFGDNFFFSSSTRFCFTSDNESLIFEAGVNEYLEGLNEPLSAIFSYNLMTKSINRISKKGLCVIDLWVDNQDLIYFSGFENTNEPSKIYQTSLTDSTLIELINNGMRPSVSHKL